MVCPLFPNYNDCFIRFFHSHFTNSCCAFYMFKRVGFLCLRQSEWWGKAGFYVMEGCLEGVTANHSFQKSKNNK